MDLDIMLIKYLSNGNYTSQDNPPEKRMRLLAFYIQEMKEMEETMNFMIDSITDKDANKAHHLGFTTGMIQCIIVEMQNEHDLVLALSKIPHQNGVADPTKIADV